MNFDSNVLSVAIEDIIPNRFQPRLAFEDDSLNDLAASIKEHGIIQPLVLRRIGDKYEIIAGERRYKGAQLAGLSSVPAVIAQIDDAKSAEVAIAENVQRKELNAIEEALSYKALLDQGYMSEEQLARKMGLSPEAIKNKLRLLTLSQEVQDAVSSRKISDRHARSLLAISDQDEQEKWLNRIINERLTVRQLDEEIKSNYKESKMNDMQNQNVSMPLPISVSMPQSSSIGTQKTNTFFNNLEEEEVNMEMTEAINPLSSNFNPNVQYGFEVAQKSEPTQNVEQQPIAGDIDSLDFSPAGEQSTEIAIDFTNSDNEINDLIAKLKEKYNVSLDIALDGNQKTYTIKVGN